MGAGLARDGGRPGNEALRKTPQRVEQVIAKVRGLSEAVGANPEVTEQVYRAMIAALIQQELAEHAALTTDQTT